MRYSENFQGLFSCQTQESRKASTQMVFMFIGAWLVILLALFGLMKWTNRKAAPESASTAEKSKSKARR